MTTISVGASTVIYSATAHQNMPHHPEDKDDGGAANADGTGVAAGENGDDKSAASAEASALANEESSRDYEADAIDVGAAPPPLLPPAQCTVAATSEPADFLDALGHDDMGRRELFGNEGDASPPVHKPPSGRAKNKDDDGALTRNPSKGRGRKKKVPNDHTKCQVKGCPSFPPIVDVCVCAEPSCEKTVHVACYNNLAGKYKVVVMEEHVFCTVTCQKKFKKKQAPTKLGWENDGAQGPNDGATSMYYLLQWLNESSPQHKAGGCYKHFKMDQRPGSSWNPHRGADPRPDSED
mmetsp:Transcript_32869/g.68951  ORF Transcript_32869/g.68951 Transcript_32869/m.68951 type:complete len:294 (-) Transcript_32869:162-1043(-)